MGKDLHFGGKLDMTELIEMTPVSWQGRLDFTFTVGDETVCNIFYCNIIKTNMGPEWHTEEPRPEGRGPDTPHRMITPATEVENVDDYFDFEEPAIPEDTGVGVAVMPSTGQPQISLLAFSRRSGLVFKWELACEGVFIQGYTVSLEAARGDLEIAAVFALEHSRRQEKHIKTAVVQ